MNRETPSAEKKDYQKNYLQSLLNGFFFGQALLQGHLHSTYTAHDSDEEDSDYDDDDEEGDEDAGEDADEDGGLVTGEGAGSEDEQMLIEDAD